MATTEHRNVRLDRVACAVLTVSDTRTPLTDESGKLIRNRLAAAGHQVASHEIIPDDAVAVCSRVLELCRSPAIHVVLLTGGTGLAARDTTCEAVESVCKKNIEGFGELFRMLSFEQVGSSAMLSRATAGVCNSTAVFCMPGSTGAVALALDRLILPEITHIAALLGK
ncbi:MAG: molybdenum cofactor biosynthesis protein B [Phycisphaerae bacterium]